MPSKHAFDVEAFLARPLVARVAKAGPSVRPIWFLWEEGAFWWITGAYARLPEIFADDARIALVLDWCDLRTGEVQQVTARGSAEVVEFDPDRARRKLIRYLGPDETSWDERFNLSSLSKSDAETRLVRLVPERLSASDLSFSTGG